MKKKLSVLCIMVMVMQLVLSNIVIPTYAEETVTEEYTAPESPAVIYNMNIDWKFTKAASDKVFPLATALEGVAKDGKNFYEVGYDDSDWQTVSIPHPINAEDSFDNVGVDAGEQGLYRGFMFYRKNITIPETDAGKKFLLEFEAFRQSVYVYVNGEMVGYYEAGVAPVGFDLTDYIKPGEENLIAVATDNASSRGSSFNTQETIPGQEPGNLSGYGYQWNTKDFNEVQGGLTGNVNLYAKNKIYQTLPLYNNLKTTGNYIYGSNFDLRENSADITVEAEVRNETAEAKDITLEVNVVDGDGNVVANFESEAVNVAAATDTEEDQFLTTVPENAYVDGVGQENNNVDISTVEVTKITATQNVSDLRFWSDKSPYLYTVYSILKDGDTVIDVDKKVTGFRSVEYDKDDGLLINGISTYLKGYAQRSTNEWAAIGVANDWLSDIDMQLVKESNANLIRWMHIAPNPVDIRAGDKYGVISIAPAGDKESDVTGRAWDQRVEAMRDTIIYFRNSPSVLFWEAGNDKISNEHMKEMTELKMILDPSGGRYMGSRAGTTSALPMENAEWAGTIIHRQDTVMYQEMGTLNNYVPMIETEYHRNEAPRRVWDDYSPPDYDYVNKWLGNGGSKTDGYDVWDQTQEDFSRTMFNSNDGYSYFYNNRVGGSGLNMYSGASLMVWSDSNMHVRNCGVENARTSGRVDPIRVKKESFYAIQAAQSDEPKIHILGHWNYPSYIEGDKENGNYWYEDKTFDGTYWVPNGNFLQRNPTKKTVYVIGSTGLSKVELYVNDELVGTDTTPTDNFIYEFPNVDVTKSGKVYAKAYNEREEVAAEHEIKTAGTPARIKLTPITGPEGFLADGSDLFYVDVEIVDEEGNVCPLDERKINFSLADDSTAVFLGGYNSGVGDRIVNHKDYVFAECGINRVFVRSTRNAGDVTLTASAEGMQPVSITVESKALELTDGLTTHPQQAFKQGEIVIPPPPETAPSLKSLGAVFTADWTEETGNVIKVSEVTKDYYTVTVNGNEVTFTDKAYKPDSSTGVVGEVNPILDALKDAGVNISYEYITEGDIPSYAYGELPYITVKFDDNTIDIVNVSTDIFVNKEKNLSNFGIGLNSSNTALMAELSAAIGSISGVRCITDEEKKTFAITTDDAVATLSETESEDALSDVAFDYADGKISVTADKDLTDVNLIIIGFNSDSSVSKIDIQKISLTANKAAEFNVDENVINSNSAKAMIWKSDLKALKPICAAYVLPIEDSEGAPGAPGAPEAPQTTDAPQATGEPTSTDKPQATGEPTIEPVLDKVYEYDKVLANDTCETEKTNGVVSTDTSPDGTAYLTATGGDICLTSIGNSKADLMWEADVRFNAEGSSIIPRDDGDKKYGTCVIRNDGDGVPKLSIQTGGSSFTRYVEIDPTAWYKIVLIGRYSAPDAKTDMIAYKYEADGSLTKIGSWENVSQRNLSANSNNGASHWNAGGGISVDNAKITALGADTLYVTSDADELTVGNAMQFDYSATRQSMYITKPNITWEVYNADNTAVIEDENITITSGGILNVGLKAEGQTINVRATAESGIYASKTITVKSVDISNVKFDVLTLSAEKEYVSANEPLKITASATKNGEAVTLEDNDLIWYAADSTDMMKLGDSLKWIKIENGVVTVDPKAVTQDITIRAADPEDKIRGSIKVHVKAVDALEGGEDGTIDSLLTSDNCEGANVNASFTDSVDGTHAYQVSVAHKTGNIADTTGDVVIELDAKFTTEGVGWHITNNNNKVTCQIVYHNGNLCVQHGGSAYVTLTAVDPTKWYHIKAIRKQGAYFHVFIYEYNENGEREFVALKSDLPQRNDSSMSAINVFSGLIYDNLRVLSPVPTDITISTDVETVFAGNTVQATSELKWNDAVMKNPSADMFEYRIYDSENKYPREGEDITVDANGLISVAGIADAQDVYVRAVAKKSGKYASAKFSVVSSDILAINKLGVSDENESKLVKLFVTKNFYYADELTFITQVYDENGAVKQSSIKRMYGDALSIGENEVSINMELVDFDKTKDTIKVFAITKLAIDTDKVSQDYNASVTIADNKATFEGLPFDAESDVIVAVYNSSDLDDSCVVFFDQVPVEKLAEGIIANNADKANEIVYVSGKIGGTLTVLPVTIK